MLPVSQKASCLFCTYSCMVLKDRAEALSNGANISSRSHTRNSKGGWAMKECDEIDLRRMFETKQRVPFGISQFCKRGIECTCLRNVIQ